MQIMVKIRWLKYLVALLFFGYQILLLRELRTAREQYQQGLVHIRHVQGELFLVQEQQRQINETYTQTWAQQTRTSEMMYEMGQDICDKRRGILKKFPNVAKQSPRVQSNPWE